MTLDTGSFLNINQDIEIQSLVSNSTSDVISFNTADLTINNPVNTPETIAGQITGNGVLNKDGVNTLTLTNTTNDYTGGTNILNGTLIASTQSLPSVPNPTTVNISNGAVLVFNDSTSGVFSGNITNDGELDYIGIASSMISGNITGTGLFFVGVGGGQVTLLGTNTYSGGTTVQDASILVGNTTSLQGAISITGAKVTFDQATNGIFSGTITGDNSSILYKENNGILTFNTPSPLFLGTTNVNAGTLNLNALLGGDVFVNSGILSGIGTVGGNLSILSGATISPGNSIGTLTVNGNYTQAAGSTYFLEIDGAGNADLISVVGTATLNGGQVVVTSLDGAALIGTPYTILTATGGLNGTFAGVSTTNPLLVPTLSYDGNNAYLNISQLVFHFDAVTPNQIAVATQLESITDPTAEEFLILNTLAALTPAEQQAALNQMSGEQYASLNLAAEIAGRQFIRRLYDPLRSIVTTEPCNDCCCECPCPTLDVWFEAGGGQTFLDGNSNARGYKMSGYEVTAGIQSTFNRDWTLGIAGSYAEDHIKYDIGNNGKNRMGFVAAYGLYRPSNFYVLADLAFGGGQFIVNRSIDIGDLAYTTKGRPNHYQGLAYIETGFDWNTCNFLIQPFLGFEGGYFRRNSISETGTSPLNLDINRQSYGNAFSRLGVHLTTEQWSALKLSVDLAWDCRLTSTKRSITENFQSFGDAFAITGIPGHRNSVDVAVTGITKLCGGWELYLEAGGEFWSKVSTYNVLGGVKYSW